MKKISNLIGQKDSNRFSAYFGVSKQRVLSLSVAIEKAAKLYIKKIVEQIKADYENGNNVATDKVKEISYFLQYPLLNVHKAFSEIEYDSDSELLLIAALIERDVRKIEKALLKDEHIGFVLESLRECDSKGELIIAAAESSDALTITPDGIIENERVKSIGVTTGILGVQTEKSMTLLFGGFEELLGENMVKQVLTQVEKHCEMKEQIAFTEIVINGKYRMLLLPDSGKKTAYGAGIAKGSCTSNNGLFIIIDQRHAKELNKSLGDNSDCIVVQDYHGDIAYDSQDHTVSSQNDKFNIQLI